MSTYLSAEGKIVVNGTLYLPSNPTQEQIDSLPLSGTGTVLFGYGSSDTYYPINITGGMADKTCAKSGDTVTLTPTAVPGRQFYGWEATPSNVTFTKNEEDGTYTFTMPSSAVTITPEYAYTVTFTPADASLDLESPQAA